MFKFKKILAIFLSLVTCIMLLAGCGNVNNIEATVDPNITDAPATTAPKITPAPTEAPLDIDPSTVDYTTQTWVALDISFTSSITYTKPLDQADFDVIFTSPTGEQMKMPGFWDGGTIWKVRFAPTSYGVWTYKTICSDSSNTGLNGKQGKIGCNVYKGDLAIYQHGFVKTEENVKYFMYADGTPFFYLGDTHWSMPSEPFNTSSVAGIASQFKYIVDKRVAQGFTVYQSEPIGAQYNFDDGVTQADIKGLQDLDARFKYIADKGLVHANSQFFFTTLFDYASQYYPTSYLNKLCRLWVARYAAYPVMWTTAQECDPSSATNTAWLGVATKMHELDPYSHPLTAHQVYANMDSVKGSNATKSSFRNIVGHSWYAVQWTPGTASQLDFNIPKDYWLNGQGKPTVIYEGSYDHLWTLEDGARQQGWAAYLNGMFGQGYGAIDIWLYNSTYDTDEDTVRGDFTVTMADKKIKWNVSIDFPAATQLGTYMHNFFNSFEWWKLVPCFDDRDNNYIKLYSSMYSAATIGNETYVAYFYNKNTTTGSLYGLEQGKNYTAKWYNPRNGEYTDIASDISGINDSVTNKLYWDIPDKPDNQDWVLLATMNK